MKQDTATANDTETSSSQIGDRLVELINQRWNRGKSVALAGGEGIALADANLAGIMVLRRYYLEHGLSINARTTAMMLNHQFSGKGGNKYLRRPFGGGPVTQGSRYANVPAPADSSDPSFGTNYLDGLAFSMAVDH